MIHLQINIQVYGPSYVSDSFNNRITWENDAVLFNVSKFCTAVSYKTAETQKKNEDLMETVYIHCQSRAIRHKI
jgi:hypothetical protein